MASSSSTGAGAPDKPYPQVFHAEAIPPIVAGVVQHRLLTASIQVAILSTVDATGSASIGDIAAELSDHPDPVGAILLLVAAGILVTEVRGVLDANSLVRRADPDPSGPEGVLQSRLTEATAVLPDLPDGIESVATAPFAAQVFVGSGQARRAFGKTKALRRPGVYVLMNGLSAYAGVGSDTGQRIACGQQPIEAVDTIIAITDANGQLTFEEAKALERMLWSRIAASGERTLVNGVPDGASIDPQRYSELEAFLGQACVALRHNNTLFVEGSARAVLAGPRSEPNRVGSLRRPDDVPEGEVLELNFGNGLVALAARQAETRWLVLRGSDVRAETVASANASARFLRAAWLHAGLLAPSADGTHYTVMRDLIFASGSAAAQFCCGSKGRGLAGWQPIAPDGGYDPDTPALIAA